MKPWELKGSDETTLPYWQRLNPEDFYFAIKREDDATVVCIVPGEYYETSGRMYVDSMPIRFLPFYLVEVTEGVYETSKPLSVVYEDLIRIGFIHNNDFQTFMSFVEIMK